MKRNINVPPTEPIHEKFKLGQGYASSEKGSDEQAHRSLKQYGDNPLPKSGGSYARSGEAQPEQSGDETGPMESAPQSERMSKKKHKDRHVQSGKH